MKMKKASSFFCFWKVERDKRDQSGLAERGCWERYEKGRIIQRIPKMAQRSPSFEFDSFRGANGIRDETKKADYGVRNSPTI